MPFIQELQPLNPRTLKLNILISVLASTFRYTPAMLRTYSAGPLLQLYSSCLVPYSSVLTLTLKLLLLAPFFLGSQSQHFSDQSDIHGPYTSPYFLSVSPLFYETEIYHFHFTHNGFWTVLFRPTIKLTLRGELKLDFRWLLGQLLYHGHEVLKLVYAVAQKIYIS